MYNDLFEAVSYREIVHSDDTDSNDKIS